MSTRFILPAAGQPAPPRRLRDWLLQSRAGRVLLGLLAVKLMQWTGLPVADVFVVLANVLLFGYFCWALLRFGRRVAQLVFWRIRTRLLVSYVFIGVVPIVLLLVLAGLAGILGLSLFAGHTLATHVERKAELLGTAATASLAGLPGENGAAAQELGRRLGAIRQMHPQFSYTLVRDGKAAVKVGAAPSALPAWVPAEGFSGLVDDEGEVEFLRAVARHGKDFLVLQVPVDGPLFADLERETTIRHLVSGGTVISDDRELDIEFGDRKPDGPKKVVHGMLAFAVLDRRNWADGETANDPFVASFQPREYLTRLSTGAVNLGDKVVQGLAIVGAVFLVVYFVAALIGLLIARSITKSVHALYRGTERLRQGDFHTPIPVYGRNQLGELAESFNLMSRGIQELLVEQAEKERLAEELRIARQIQMKLLPQGTVTLPGLRIAALCLPAAEVGGDYYDLLPLTPTKMGVLVADVSGKGTSAALYMAELKGLVLSLSRIYDSPARLLAEANRILAGTMDSRSFITMTYAVVDTEARTLRYARAGHNPLIHLEASTGATRVLAPAGLGLGIDRHGRFEEILEESTVPLAEGDVFLFFTDGISEAMNGKAELFGEHRLRDLISRSEAMNSEQIKAAILDEINVFVAGAAQHDDMTMVILKVDRASVDEDEGIRLELLGAAS